MSFRCWRAPWLNSWALARPCDCWSLFWVLWSVPPGTFLLLRVPEGAGGPYKASWPHIMGLRGEKGPSLLWPVTVALAQFFVLML